jgi:hypothetical protein
VTLTRSLNHCTCDRKCSGLFVSIITAGTSTFFKFTDRPRGKQRCKWLGVYNPETFTVDHARTKVYALKTRIGNGENIAESFRQQKATAAKLGVTVDQVIDERVKWMGTKVEKRDGEMRPRIESWENVESHLRRFVSPRQEASERGHQERHRAVVERYRRGRVRQAVNGQRPPHAPRRLGDVHMGGGSGPRLRHRVPLRQPAGA